MLDILTCDFLTNLPAAIRIFYSVANRWKVSNGTIVLTDVLNLISEHLGARGSVYFQITINARMTSRNKCLSVVYSCYYVVTKRCIVWKYK